MSGNTKQWLIKDADGKVYGPYEMEKVFRLIESYVFTGAEKIAEFPKGDFISISHMDEVYDKFLEVWEGEVRTLSKDERTALLKNAQEEQQRNKPDTDLSQSQNTKSYTDTIPLESTKSKSKKKDLDSQSVSFVDEVSSGNENSITTSSPGVQESPKKQGRAVKQGSLKRLDNTDTNWGNSTEDTRSGKTDAAGRKVYENVIDVSRASSVNKRLFVRALGIIVACVIALYFYKRHPAKALRESAQIHLIAPKIKKMSDKVDQKKRISTLKTIIGLVEKDDFSSYLKAQNISVDLLEQIGPDADTLGLLCTIYKELWPYSKKDSHDLSVVSKVNQIVSRIDVGGKASANCRATQFIVADNFVSAEQVVDKALQDFPGVAVFYSLKGEISEFEGQWELANSYYQKTISLWPNWLNPRWRSATLLIRRGDYSGGQKSLREIVQVNSLHKLAAIDLAEIEFNYFKNRELAKKLLDSVAENAQHLPRVYRAKAFLILSYINLSENKNSDAIRYAKNAYELDTKNEQAKSLLEKLAGEEAFLSVFRTEQELLENGDLYFRRANYLAAQAEYKAAFELNENNEIAGIRAAQALWRLNQSNEAVRWLQKTIEKNPKSVLALLSLAEYQIERYDFEGAAKSLKRASSIQKEDYRVLRGFAAFELKRNNYKAAKEFSEKAIRLYDTDMESHYILARAMLGLGAYDQAYKTIARAVGLEPTNSQAQALYAEVLALFQGVDAGVRYISNLINTYPAKLEYRESLAKIYLKDARWELAVRVLKPITEVRSDYKSAFILLASAYIGMNKAQDALEAYLAAASLDPTDATPYIEIGQLYLLTGKFESAKEQFERAARLNPNYPRVNYLLGKSYLYLKNHKKAIESALKERSRNPMIADSYLLAADAYLEQRQFNQAITEFQSALQLRPQSAEIYVKLAVCYRLIGSLDVADQMLSTAIAKESAYPDIYKEAGAIMEKRGKAPEAIEAYQKYLSLKPNAKDAGIIRGRIKGLGG